VKVKQNSSDSELNDESESKTDKQLRNGDLIPVSAKKAPKVSNSKKGFSRVSSTRNKTKLRKKRVSFLLNIE
jgi:hypothetical protein